MQTRRFVRGDTFTHPTMLDTSWKPGPGQKYADGPKAQCRVTRTRGESVYYAYVTSDGTPGGRFVTTQSALNALMEAYPVVVPV